MGRSLDCWCDALPPGLDLKAADTFATWFATIRIASERAISKVSCSKVSAAVTRNRSGEPTSIELGRSYASSPPRNRRRANDLAVAWRPLAERDLIDCAAHIAQDNTDAALRFIDAVEETVASLAVNPMRSTAAHFAHPDLAGIRRRVVNGFKRYLIFYRSESATQTVELVRILPGERDFPEALVEPE